ncbi:hypothetical protein [Streptomyces sp. NPDC047803]|uniref:hypothetical protein n=1 Tax=unclassified Streptomyces TaxID=2593676 RepID=UPI0033C18F6F
MRAPTDTTAKASEGRGLQPPAYGAPSPDLLARADRGLARFLARHSEDQPGHNPADDEEVLQR